MRNLVAVTVCSALALTACDRAEQSTSAEGGSVAPAMVAAPEAYAPTDAIAVEGRVQEKAAAGESYVYDHNMTLSMSSEFIKTRFERAKDRCQNDAALKCKVTSASFQVLGQPDAPLPVAHLSVSLPHESVQAYESSLLESLPSEDAADILVKSRNTSAQNVTNQVRDIEARLSQLRNYRERMQALAGRRNAETDDLIKIEGEISKTQGEIEQIEGQQRDLADRIAKENLSISFEASSTTSDAFQPVREVWQGSLKLLAESAASAIALVVGIIPWIPVVLLAFFGGRFLWRRTARK
jgi:hypothetical protein